MLEHDASIKRLEQKKVDLGSGLIISSLIRVLIFLLICLAGLIWVSKLVRSTVAERSTELFL